MIPPLLALFAWPIAVVIFYRRYDAALALILSIILGYLVLPPRVGIDLPALPELNKNSIPALAAFVVSLAVLRSSPGRRASVAETDDRILPGILPRSKPILLFLILLVGGAFLTPLVNGDPQVFPNRRLPGLGLYDSLSFSMTAVVGILPLLLARKYLAHPDTHRTLLRVLAVAGAAYALLALYEVRMSPQLSNDIYGISARSWMQQIRAGGFRPLVFLEHGLWLGILLACTALAAFAAWRIDRSPQRNRYLMAGLLILLALSLSKTLGALAIVIILLPIALFLGVRAQILTAAAISVVVIFYPLLRSADLVPVDKFVEFAGKISAERAGSLQFRLRNEDILLEKAMQRPVLGWGGWGRARVYDEYGNDLSVTDGFWVISMGVGGFVRYFGEFGLLAATILLLALRRRHLELTLATTGVCLVLAANLVDLIPNAGMSPITWLMAGALAGRFELAKITEQMEVPPEQVSKRSRSYGRPLASAGPRPRGAAASSRAGAVPTTGRKVRHTRFDSNPTSGKS